MDFFDDDEPSAPAARPVGKFKPKVKPKAQASPSKKESSAANASVPRQAEDNQLVASLSNTPNNDVSDSAALSNAGAKYESSVAQTVNVQPPSDADPFISSLENPGRISSACIEENDTSKHSEDQCLNSGESMVESTEVFIRLDAVDDLMPQSTTVADATVDASNSHYGEDTNGIPINQERLGYKDDVFNNVEAIQLVKGHIEKEGGHDFTSLESLDFMYEAGASSGKIKFQLKLKSKSEKKTAAVESVSHPKDNLVVPSETLYRNEEGSVDGGLPSFPHARVDDAFSTECLLNEVELLQASPDFMSDLPSSADAATECLLSPTAQLLQSSSGFVSDFQPSMDPLNQGGESQCDPSLSEHLHSESVPVMSEMLNENEQGGTVGSQTSKISKETGLENNCGDNEEGEGSKKKKKSSSRSKTDAHGIDKSVRKRKKTTEASEKSSEQPPKKFSHSTRRRNRCINKSLLETPEDEIDYQRLPIKDLITLAEYRERQNKETDTGQTAVPTEDQTAEDRSAEAPSERADNNMWEDPPYDDYNYDDMYTSGQAEGSFDDPSTSAVQRDTTYFNYQSHMEKTPRAKWSKQGTELFYEAVRQFGSDLSMIQHLFPGLTRHQIKLKYKKEERQHPMRLLDALTNRAKDLSHFQLVIGKLQEQINREEAQERAEEAASAGATGNEGSPEGGVPETQVQSEDAATNSKQNYDGLGTVKDPDGAKIGSPTASSGSDLETYAWSEYKSEF